MADYLGYTQKERVYKAHQWSKAGQHRVQKDTSTTNACPCMSQVLAGDSDIGDRLPIPTDTMQLFDETRGEYLLSGQRILESLISDSCLQMV